MKVTEFVIEQLQEVNLNANSKSVGAEREVCVKSSIKEWERTRSTYKYQH